MTSKGKRIDTVLFDLGQTLVGYYTREQFPEILDEAIGEVALYLRRHSLLKVSLESAWAAAPSENYESKDPAVRPLLGRLCRIFHLDESEITPEVDLELSRRFLRPTFRIAHLYEDSLPVLGRLRSEGYRTAIVSNTPWGTPASLWREELDRWRLSDAVDMSVFCMDAGVRKPGREIFEYTLDKLGTSAKRCLFVGDNPKWDIAGPQAIGMEAFLIQRESPEESSRNLYQLLDYLGL